MKKYKVVNEKGNEATESQVFGVAAYKAMEKALTELVEKGELNIAGNEYKLTDEALTKIEGIKKHISDRWNKEIKAVEIVQKEAVIEW